MCGFATAGEGNPRQIPLRGLRCGRRIRRLGLHGSFVSVRGLHQGLGGMRLCSIGLRLAVMLSRDAMRLGGCLMKFGGFRVVGLCHDRSNQIPRSVAMVDNGLGGHPFHPFHCGPASSSALRLSVARPLFSRLLIVPTLVAQWSAASWQV